MHDIPEELFANGRFSRRDEVEELTKKSVEQNARNAQYRVRGNYNWDPDKQLNHEFAITNLYKIYMQLSLCMFCGELSIFMSFILYCLPNYNDRMKKMSIKCMKSSV